MRLHTLLAHAAVYQDLHSDFHIKEKSISCLLTRIQLEQHQHVRLQQWLASLLSFQIQMPNLSICQSFEQYPYCFGFLAVSQGAITHHLSSDGQRRTLSVRMLSTLEPWTASGTRKGNDLVKTSRCAFATLKNAESATENSEILLSVTKGSVTCEHQISKRTLSLVRFDIRLFDQKLASRFAALEPSKRFQQDVRDAAAKSLLEGTSLVSIKLRPG